MIQCACTGTALTQKKWKTEMNSKLNELRRFWFAGFVILLAIPGLTFAQVPAAVEGPISFIEPAANGDGLDVTVMGVVVNVPAKIFPAAATTPTENLTQAALLDETSLDGRWEKGFIGGTAIINGTSSVADGFVAQDFFVEASETVLIGTVTSVDLNPLIVRGANLCDIYVEGVLMVFSDDLRMPFDKSINGSGFAVKPCTVVAGNSVAGEGYYGAADGAFHIFIFESDDAALAETGGITTITRASCRTGRSIEVRGSSTYILAGGTANVFDAKIPPSGVPTKLGSAALAVDALTATSIYRARETIGGDCPQNIYVETWDSNGVFISSSLDSAGQTPVDIR
jgi:hypothetical protein